MKNLKIKNFGRIKKGNINFGDLTVFVGPQATGKTLVLELIKLVKDCEYILWNFYTNGFIWWEFSEFLNLYYGEGLYNIWRLDTKIFYNDQEISFNEDTYSYNYIRNKYKKEIFHKLPKKYVYYIPAQRILTIENGFPKNFQNYERLTPYVLKEFSEYLRSFLDIIVDVLIENNEYNTNRVEVYPLELKRLTKIDFSSILKNIFLNLKLEVSEKNFRKRLILNLNGIDLPFMSWSSGQKEFIPLFLAFINLIVEREKKTIIIEEPEMGLHPKALETVLIMILYLMYLDYKVVISTHSADVLELIWALKNIKESNIDDNRKINLLNKLFELNTKEFNKIWEKVLKKNYKTYYFEPVEENVFIRDISDLDPFEDKAISEWGGLISFSTKVSDILSELPYEE
ncbi:MAG: hypothetical protein DSY59_03420 [Persephonella sp.]|nr:MAG: hypothetical protein DSY59_03420 [Persephonella sp.]